MDEAALWDLINAGRERMNLAQRRLWDVFGIDRSYGRIALRQGTTGAFGWSR